MKILITIPCLLTGGTEFQTLNLVRALKAENHSVMVCCFYDYIDEMVDLFIKHGAEVVLFSNENEQRPSSFRQITFLCKNLKKLILKFKPDLAHVQYMTPGALPIIALKCFGVKKIVATLHQPYTKSHGKLSKILVQIAAKLCFKFVVVSKNAEKSWFGSGQIYDKTIPLKDQPKHFTIYNAVDVELIQKIQNKTDIVFERYKLEIPTKSIVFGAVSRLSYEKGIDILIDAFYQVQKENKNVYLLIVGDGPDEKMLQHKVKQYNIESKIIFYGGVNWETAMQQMALMDVVVVPSRFEGFGLSAAEAMAMGKPVVASNVFGLKEVVNDKKTGLLFNFENATDLEKQLLKLLNNPNTSKILGAAGLLKVKSKFSSKVFKTEINNFYKSIFEI